MLKIKICGITNIEDATAAVNCGADALGFIFAKSPRRISPAIAKKIISSLPVFVSSVGVFVNAKKTEVLKILKICKFQVLQFHGDESDNYCKFFRKYCKIIKAFRIKDKKSLNEVLCYKYVDAYLFDSYVDDCYGGTGRQFKHSLLKNFRSAKPIIIAGGLDSKNIEYLIKYFKPYAVDISSSVEKSPGKKNIRQLRVLIQKAKKAIF